MCVKNKTFPPLEISSMSTETSSFKPAMTSKAASFFLSSLSYVEIEREGMQLSFWVRFLGFNGSFCSGLSSSLM